MEVNKRFLTILTPEGEFLRTRKLDALYQIGQEIEFFSRQLAKRKKKGSFLQCFSKKKELCLQQLVSTYACLHVNYSLIPK